MALSHSLTATTPDDPTYEIRPSHWNAAHVEVRALSGNTVGASTVSGSNVVFQAGNNMTLSANADTLVFIGPSPSGGAFSAGVSTGGNTAGATGISGTQLVLAGGNNVTLSQTTGANGATVTVSAANQSVQTQGMVTVQGSTGAITFSAANGITFGGNASTITASHNGLTSQSNQAFSAAGGSSAFQTLVFADSQGVSWSNSNGSVVATVRTNYAASDVTSGRAGTSTGFTGANISGSMTHDTNGLALSLSVAAPGGAGFSAGVSTGGNTSGQTGVTGTRLVFAGGNNITLSQGTDANGATVTISGANAGGAQTGISGIIVSNTTYTSGTVSFSNANGISFGSSAGQAITASYTVPSTAGLISAINLSAGTTSNNLTAFTLSNSNGLAFGLNGSVVTGSYTVPTLTSWTVSDTATSATVGRLAFSAANGLTFGLSTSNNGNHTVTATYTVPTQSAQTVGLYGSSNTTGQSSSSTVDARSISIVGAGVASVGLSGGSFIVSVPSGGGANFSAGVSTDGNTAGATGVTGTRLVFVGSNMTLSQTTGAAGGTITFVGPSPTSAGVTNAGNTSGNTGFVTGQFNLQGGNNITLSGSTNGGSMSVTISGANQSNQSLGIYASSGTMGQSSSSTYDARSLTLVGSGAASVGWSNGSLIISAPNAAAGNVTFSAGTASAGLASVVFSNSNNVSFGLNGSTITGSVPATSSIVGVSGVSISTAGATISVQPNTQSYFAYPDVIWNTQTHTVGSNTSYVWPIEVHEVEQFDYARMIHSISIASMASVGTTANTTFSYNQQGSYNFVAYTRGTGANSQSLQSVGSTSHSSRMSVNVQANANGSQWSVTHAISYPMSSTAQATASFSYATTLSNINISTTHMTALTGVKMVAFPWASTFSGQNYYIATGFNTAQTTQGTASLSNMRVTWSGWGASQINQAYAEVGAATNSSLGALYGLGSWTTNAVGTTNSIALANISSSASHVIPYVTLARIA